MIKGPFYALGVDPGTERANVKTSPGVTFAIVEHVPGSNVVRWVEAGSFDPSLTTIEAFALRFRSVHVIGIEVAAGAIFEPFRAPGVLAQNVIAGMLLMAVHIQAGGAKLVRLAPESWRKGLTGKKSVGRRKDGVTFDEVIARHLAVNVRGMPATRSSHHRDAVGIAVVAGRAAQRGMVRPDGTVDTL